MFLIITSTFLASPVQLEVGDLHDRIMLKLPPTVPFTLTAFAALYLEFSLGLVAPPFESSHFSISQVISILISRRKT